LNLDTASINSIKDELEKDRDAEFYKKINARWESHNRKIEKKGARLYAISLALDFLSHDDNLLDIMLVCRNWKAKLEKKLYKVRLSEIDEKITVQTRLKVWKSILRLVKNNHIYVKYKNRIQLE